MKRIPIIPTLLLPLAFLSQGSAFAQGSGEEVVQLAFVMYVGEMELDLEKGTFNSPSEDLQIDMFRFYISGIAPREEGREV